MRGLIRNEDFFVTGSVDGDIEVKIKNYNSTSFRLKRAGISGKIC